MMPGDESFLSHGFRARAAVVCVFASVRGLWGLELRFRTIQKPPQPLRPLRRTQTAAQDEYVTKTAAAPICS